MRVLVTGVSGHIGRVLADGLAPDIELRGLDLHPPAEDSPADVRLGDCSDPAIADEAVRGVDAVVHLAGIPSEASLPDILTGHVLGTAALLDAMVRHGVARMVYASSNHAVGMTPRTRALPASAPPRPDTLYGVGKVAGEALLSLYADRYGLSCVALRIGSFLPRPTSRRHLATWLSHRDCVALVRAALTADVDGMTTVWGISANRDAWWDSSAGRLLGYSPRDDAAAYEDDIPDGPDDAAEAERVGGPLTAASVARPALDHPGEPEASPW